MRAKNLAKNLEWQSSTVVRLAVLAVASASVAGCADSSRFGDGPGYAPATANQQTYLGNPQYAQSPAYRAETTGSIQPSYSQPQPEPWYGRPWQSPQAAPPAYRPPPYSQQTYQPQPYPPAAPVYQAPTYQAPSAPPTYSQSLRPLAAERPQPVRPLAVAPPQPAAQPQMVLQPGPRAVQPPLKAAVAQPMPAPAPAPIVQAQIPRRAAAPMTTGSTGGQPAYPANQQKLPLAAQPMPAPVPAPIAQAPVAQVQPLRADQRQLASNWSSTGGSYVQLKPGESISTLSQRYGVPVTAIMSANNFADATRVQPGQQVLIPTYVYNATPKPVAPTPHVALQPAPVPVEPPAPRGGEHVVRHGESLDSIARMYGIPRQKLEVANHLHGDAVLRPGQKLEIPMIGGRHVADATTKPTDSAAPMSAASAQVPAKAPPVQQAISQPLTQPAPVKVPDQKLAANASGAETSILVAQEPKPSLDPVRTEAKAPSFRWPVRGRVIEAFGASNGGSRNDGINLAVPEGTSVKSAEDGEVIYSGNELKGYGNVVLVKHADGWVTVYAHASDLLVNKGDKVTRGQIIARAGATGSVTQPQLHFELRKGQKPVDPKTYLTN